jgi:hypothetical protein
MSYTYITQEKIRVPAIRETEPALSELYLARKQCTLREQIHIDVNRRRYHRSGKSASGNIEYYLESAAQEIHHRDKSLKYQIFEIGRVLCSVKKLIPHGKFLAWVEQKTPYSKSTARNFMRVYKACLGYPEVTQFFKPSELYEICRPSFPQEFRDELFIKTYKERRANDIGREKLLEILNRWKRGEIQIESPEVQNLLMIEKDRDYFHLYKKELEALQKILEDRLNKFERLDFKFISSPLLETDKDDKADEYFEVLEMIDGFIADIKLKIENINPDLNRRRKICENANVTNLKNHKITRAKRTGRHRRSAKRAGEDTVHARKSQTRRSN